MLVELIKPVPADAETSLRQLWDATSADLAKQLPFDSLCVGSADPASGMIDTGQVAGLRLHCLRALLTTEFTVEDFNTLDWLTTQRNPVGLLSEATDGELDRSHRYRTLLRPQGLQHELRLALVSRGVCWGYLVLCRNEGRPEFSPTEIACVRKVAATLTERLMTRVCTIAVGRLPTGQVGVLSLDARGHIDAIDDVARAMLSRSGSQRWAADTRIPLVLATFATKLTSGTAQLPADRRALMADPKLGWLLLTGNLLRDRDGLDRPTVSIQAAPPLMVAPYLLFARGATPRSVEVTLRVLRGMTSSEIADDLRISRHTVQDHLKPVFSALSVNSRRELVGSLFPHLTPYELL